jgi:hypothetical protein
VSPAKAELSPLSSVASERRRRNWVFNSPFAKVTRQACSSGSATGKSCVPVHLALCISNSGCETYNFPLIPRYSRLFPFIPGYFAAQKATNSFSYNGLPSCVHLFQKISSELPNLVGTIFIQSFQAFCTLHSKICTSEPCTSKKIFLASCFLPGAYKAHFSPSCIFHSKMCIHLFRPP